MVSAQPTALGLCLLLGCHDHPPRRHPAWTYSTRSPTDRALYLLLCPELRYRRGSLNHHGWPLDLESSFPTRPVAFLLCNSSLPTISPNNSCLYLRSRRWKVGISDDHRAGMDMALPMDPIHFDLHWLNWIWAGTCLCNPQCLFPRHQQALNVYHQNLDVPLACALVAK